MDLIKFGEYVSDMKPHCGARKGLKNFQIKALLLLVCFVALSNYIMQRLKR